MKAVHDNTKLPYRQKMVKVMTERFATNGICSMKTENNLVLKNESTYLCSAELETNCV